MPNEGFIRRTYGTIGYVFAFVFMAAWAYGAPGRALAGLAVGVAVGTASLASIEWMVKWLLDPTKRRSGKVAFAVLGVAKFLLLGVAIYFVTRATWLSLPVFAAGVGLVQLVIVLKALGAHRAQQQKEMRG